MITNYCLHLRYLHIVTLIIMGFFKKIFGSSPSDFAKEESGYNYQKEETKIVETEKKEPSIVNEENIVEANSMPTNSNSVRVRYLEPWGSEEEIIFNDGIITTFIICAGHEDVVSKVCVGDTITLKPEINESLNSYEVVPYFEGEKIGHLNLLECIPLLACMPETGMEAVVNWKSTGGEGIKVSVPATFEYIDKHDYLKDFNIRLVTDDEEEQQEQEEMFEDNVQDIITDQDGNEYVCEELFAIIPNSKVLMEILVENFERKTAKEEVLFIGSLSDDGDASYVCQKMGATLRFNNDEMEDCMARGYFVCFSIENVMENRKVAVLKLKVYFEKGGEPME